MSLKASSAIVRPVAGDEIARVIDFLRKGFVPHLTPDALRLLFEYRWSGMSEKPSLGFALWSGNEIVGFLGAIYAERPLAGGIIKTCNLSTWYVQPEFRWASMKLLYAVLAQKAYTIINLTPSPGVRRIMELLGFEAIDRRKFVYLPWHFRRELFRSGPDVVTDAEAVAHVVEDDERCLLRDHLPYGLRHYVLRKGADYSYLVLKRRSFPGEAAFGRIPIQKVRLKWYPCMEVLYLGNPRLARDQWGSLVATILRRERVLGVVVAERFLGANAPAGACFDHRNYLLARSPLKGTIDSLYSELAVLPI